MKLILGLGNPGRRFKDSRHNIGRSVVEALGRRCGVTFKKDSGVFSLIAKTTLDAEAVILAMPFTFMNLSGVAVRALVKKYKIDLDKLLVVLDDLDLELGRLKIKPNGSSGGHKGLGSVIDYLKTQKFPRLRLGIGRPQRGIDTTDYVLSGFCKKEKIQFREVIDRAGDCCRVWATKGVQASMNIFNLKE